MGRKNHRRQHAPQRRRGVPPAPPVERLVIPRGRCGRKLRFSLEDAPRALAQARAKRQRAGSDHMEQRFYECDRCGDYHLTSREEFQGRSQV